MLSHKHRQNAAPRKVYLFARCLFSVSRDAQEIYPAIIVSSTACWLVGGACRRQRWARKIWWKYYVRLLHSARIFHELCMPPLCFAPHVLVCAALETDFSCVLLHKLRRHSFFPPAANRKLHFAGARHSHSFAQFHFKGRRFSVCLYRRLFAPPPPINRVLRRAFCWCFIRLNIPCEICRHEIMPLF